MIIMIIKTIIKMIIIIIIIIMIIINLGPISNCSEDYMFQCKSDIFYDMFYL